VGWEGGTGKEAGLRLRFFGFHNVNEALSDLKAEASVFIFTNDIKYL
jgi:hypothetical protein